MGKLKSFLKYFALLAVVVWAGVLFSDWRVNSIGKTKMYTNIDAVPKASTVIVLGASVYANGNLSPVLKDRVDTALELFNANKVERFLLSGDHGQNNYDEVNAMKNYLNKRGVPNSVIFLDHAGFDTYDSMYRADYIFNVTSAIVVTQRFHLPRALYIANRLGLDYIGVVADKRQYKYIESFERREYLAKVKAVWEVLINKKPKFLGEKIPITGNSAKSY